MHEMGVANSVIEAVRKELRFYPGERALKVGLRIGEFVAVDPESLRSCFESIAKRSNLGPVALEIDLCRTEAGCRGDELDIAYLELEEAEAAK